MHYNAQSAAIGRHASMRRYDYHDNDVLMRSLPLHTLNGHWIHSVYRMNLKIPQHENYRIS